MRCSNLKTFCSPAVLYLNTVARPEGTLTHFQFHYLVKRDLLIYSNFSRSCFNSVLRLCHFLLLFCRSVRFCPFRGVGSKSCQLCEVTLSAVFFSHNLTGMPKSAVMVLVEL